MHVDIIIIYLIVISFCCKEKLNISLQCNNITQPFKGFEHEIRLYEHQHHGPLSKKKLLRSQGHYERHKQNKQAFENVMNIMVSHRMKIVYGDHAILF